MSRTNEKTKPGPEVIRNISGHVERVMVPGEDGPVATFNLVLEGSGLMGASEVADCLGVQVPNLQFIKDLPDPVSHIRASRVWLASDIESFAMIYKMRRQARLARSTAA